MSERSRPADDVAEESTTLAQEAEAAIDAQRDQTADALQSFADTIQEKAAAERIEQTADFVHERNPRQMARQAQSVLWRQPVLALVAGAVLGFVIGRISKSA
jgi:ElaB/YqjD/DUF883 family membrane-anchored ribosome-binding protein